MRMSLASLRNCWHPRSNPTDRPSEMVSPGSPGEPWLDPTFQLDFIVEQNEDKSWTAEVRPFMPLFAKPHAVFTGETREEVVLAVGKWVFENRLKPNQEQKEGDTDE